VIDIFLSVFPNRRLSSKEVGAEVVEAAGAAGAAAANLPRVRNNNPNRLLEQTMFALSALSFQQGPCAFVRALPCFSARRAVSES
jgi:hypothetical protein